MRCTAFTSALLTAAALGAGAPAATAEPLVPRRLAGYQCDVPAYVAGFRHRQGRTFAWHCLSRDGNPYDYVLSRSAWVDGCWMKDGYRLTFKYRKRVVKVCDWPLDFRYEFAVDVVNLAFVG